MVTYWPSYVPDTVLHALSTDQVPEFSRQSCEVGTPVTVSQEIEKLNHMPREIAAEVGVVLEVMEVFLMTSGIVAVAIMMVTGNRAWVGDGGGGRVWDTCREVGVGDRR